MSRIATAALVVWAITISAAVYLFFSGYTARGSDGREVVLVTSVERVQILEEMRGLLEATADITAALARNDHAAIAEIAGPVGIAAMKGESPALLAKLPFAFKEAGLRVHTGFDTLGNAATAGETTRELTRMLSEQLLICTGCHASYRFSE
jgi:hypothetical protein